MKKLICIAIGVVFSLALRASTVIWGLYDTVDATKFAKGTAYLICASEIALPTFADDAAATAWFTDKGSTLASSALLKGEVANGAVAFSEVVESPTGRKQYWLIFVNEGETVLSVSTSAKYINIQKGNTNATAKWNAADGQVASYNIPEPTSGLFLLVGIAGLALRRKAFSA